MKFQEPIPHWNNFTVPELREILEHAKALERLGIVQDEEMMGSIQRDINLREKNLNLPRYVHFEPKTTKIGQQAVKRIQEKTNKKQRPQDYLLAQNV